MAIPEIVPFRLTRQLVTVLEPLGISGILEDAMTQIMSGKFFYFLLHVSIYAYGCLTLLQYQAIQAEKELLLNMLTVFVKEPHLEWKQAAKRQTKVQSM